MIGLTILIIACLVVTVVPFIVSTLATSDGWTIVTDGQGVKVNSDLKEYVWQKNASMAPHGQYDKIGLHRLVKTGISPLGVVFIIPGIYSSGERLVSNPSTDSFIKTEDTCQCIYWANRGFDVYTIDFRSHFIPINFDKTQLSFTIDWGMDTVISDIKEAVDQAKTISGTLKVFMAGVSWGGILAQTYAAKYWQEDLRGLILLDPAALKSTIAKNPNLTNSYNLTNSLNAIRATGGWVWENPQQSTTPSSLNPGYIFLVQFAVQNPGAPAQYLNGTLVTTINPRTNKAWTNITEWFEYGFNTASSFNTYGGYSNITFDMNMAAQQDRYVPVRQYLDYNSMLDWAVSPYMPYDYIAHVSEINIPVLAFRSGLNLAAYGNITNGMATKDFTWTILPNYGHGDVFQGTYSGKDVSEPAYQWMVSHYPPLKASASPPAITTNAGQSCVFAVTAVGTVAPYTYQWYQGNNILYEQTTSQLSLTPTKNNAAESSYYCKVTDAEGKTVNSNIVNLKVIVQEETSTQSPQQNKPNEASPTDTPPTPKPSTITPPTETPPIEHPSEVTTKQTAFMSTEIYAAVIIIIAVLAVSAALVIKKRRK